MIKAGECIGQVLSSLHQFVGGFKQRPDDIVIDIPRCDLKDGSKDGELCELSHCEGVEEWVGRVLKMDKKK